MKIVIFLNSLMAGGAERVAVNLSNAWGKLGHEITIVTLEDQSSDFYHVPSSVKRLSIGNVGESKSLWGAIRTNWRRLNSLRTLLRGERPDILIGIMTRASILAMIASIGLDCQVVVTEHNHPPKLPPGKLWSLLRHATYRYAGRVIALTEETGDWLSRKCGCKNVSIIPNAVAWPIARIEPMLSPDTVLAGDRKLILGVGRLVPQKGFDYLIQAFEIIRNKAEEWDLVILGEGADRAMLERMIADRGLEGRAFLPGRCGNVSDWYSRSGIYVLSSRFEGFPMTLIEAMSMGTSVVSYDCDTGPRDIIADGKSGRLIYPVGDVKALAKSIEELIVDESMRNQMAVHAMDVRNQYSEDRVTNLWVEMFSALIEKKMRNDSRRKT